jgi:hypothetical protein
MLDIDALIKKLQDSTTGNVTVNIINVTSDTKDDDDFDTDFEVGMRVDVCHLKKDGSGTKHTTGTVDSFGTDDFGDYVRVTGDNGNHYRCGLKLDQERKGSKIFRIL